MDKMLGFKKITGLTGRGDKLKDSSRISQRKSDANDTFRGNLSCIKTMNVQPGVILKEFKSNQNSTKKEAFENNPFNFVKVSGGNFKTDKEKSTRKMMSS